MEKLAFVLAALTMCGVVIAKEQYVLKTPTAVDIVEGGKVVRTNVLQTGTIVQVVESDKKKPLTKEEAELRIDSFLGFKFKSREYVFAPGTRRTSMEGEYICRLEKPFCLFEFAKLFCTTNGSLYCVELRMQNENKLSPIRAEIDQINHRNDHVFLVPSNAFVVSTREKLVDWIRATFKIGFEKERVTNSSARYEFQNSNNRICLTYDSSSWQELKLTVCDLAGLKTHEEEVVAMEKEKDEELRRQAFAKNEFGRDCVEQFEFERTIKQDREAERAAQRELLLAIQEKLRLARMAKALAARGDGGGLLELLAQYKDEAAKRQKEYSDLANLSAETAKMSQGAKARYKADLTEAKVKAESALKTMKELEARLTPEKIAEEKRKQAEEKRKQAEEAARKAQEAKDKAEYEEFKRKFKVERP